MTVAPTHRRRGVARALLEAELRTAFGDDWELARAVFEDGFSSGYDGSEVELYDWVLGECGGRRVGFSWDGPPGGTGFAVFAPDPVAFRERLRLLADGLARGVEKLDALVTR